MMRHAGIAVVVIAIAVPYGAAAQTASPGAQALGRRLFVQSCSVCHTNVQQGATRYGPALSQASLGGQDDVMREVIANGTPRMPAFKHHFDRVEIDAIVAYLKTVPAPQPGEQR